jgi:hypothetical protein
MNQERYQQIDALVEAALRMDGTRRLDSLHRACGSDQDYDPERRSGGKPREWLWFTAIIEAGPHHGAEDERALVDLPPCVAVGKTPRLHLVVVRVETHGVFVRDILIAGHHGGGVFGTEIGLVRLALWYASKSR